MRILALSAAFVLVVAFGCKSNSEEPATTGNPGASGGTSAATVGSFASAKDTFNACIGCHSGAGAKEGIDFTSYESIMKGGHGGPVVVAGDPAGSLVVKALRGNGAKQMPPAGALTEDKIKAVEDWIKAGAKAE